MSEVTLDEPSEGRSTLLPSQCRAGFVFTEHAARDIIEPELCEIVSKISNIDEVSLGGPEYQHHSTKEYFREPTYWYHEVIIFWSRPLKEGGELVAAAKEEARKALASSVDAIASKYELVPQ